MMDIVVIDVASFRIHPALLHRDGYDLALVVSRDAEARMPHEHRAAFDHVVVVTAVTCSSVVGAVHDLASRRGASLDDVTLLTHDEYGLLAVSQARQALGLAGAHPEHIEDFTDKVRMKAAVAAAGVRIPRFLRFDPHAWSTEPQRVLDAVHTTLGWPVFVKPLSESGTVGGERLERPGDFISWAARVGPGGRYEVDEFLHGSLWHVDTVLFEGQPLFTGVNRYTHPCYEYLSGRICASRTVDPDEPAWERLRRFNAAVVAAFGDRKPDDTALHLEVFETAAGELVFLEIAARAPAALVPAAYEKRWGFNIELAHYQAQRGIKPTRADGGPLDDTAEGPAAAWAYWPKAAGVLREIREPAFIGNALTSWNVRPGDRLTDPEDIREYAGKVLLWGDSREVVRGDLDACDRTRVLSLD
jgi:hypothetical protein